MLAKTILTLTFIKFSLSNNLPPSSDEKVTNLENSITGTGNKLEDEIYYSSCTFLNCESGCCENTLLEMKCGTITNCKHYKRILTTYKIIYGSSISIFTLIILLISLSGFYAKSHPKRSQIFLKICLIVVSIIFFPITILILFIRKFIFKNKEEGVGIKSFKSNPEKDYNEFSFRVITLNKLDNEIILKGVDNNDNDAGLVNTDGRNELYDYSRLDVKNIVITM